MTSRMIYTDGSRPLHLSDKYRVYALRFEDGELLMVHVGRPISFKTFCETYVMQHIELMAENQKKIYSVSNIIAIEKIPNSNKPDYELTALGQLIEVNG